MRIKEAKEIVGSDLGKPSKMPGYSFGIPAAACKLGSLLAQRESSVCYGCYAMKANYKYKSVMTSQARRLAQLNHKQWPEAMVCLIEHRVMKLSPNLRYFRWHDSGDIQSLHHLRNIVEVCKKTSRVKHWLPTRERGIIREYLTIYGQFPDNLTVRISDTMVDAKAPHNAYLPTSGVVRNKAEATCRAYDNNGKCGDCRMCWNPKVERVTYPLH